MNSYGLSNDGIYECNMCEAIIQCFTSTGDTEFCPCCGSRGDELKSYEPEEENKIQEQIKESVKAESNDSPKAKSNDFAKEPKTEVEE